MGWSLSIVKMSIVSKLPRFKAIPNKSLIEKFIEINKLFLKFLGNAKDRIAKATLKKHNKVEHKHYWISRHIATEAAKSLQSCPTLCDPIDKSLQSCPTLCDPIDGSPPGSPFLGFSRQEQWSGLPFPSPMNGKSESEVDQSCPTLSNPVDCSPPGSSIHGVVQARVLEWVAIAFSI